MQRRFFDEVLERTLADLPAEVSELLEEAPLIVDDEPDPSLLRETGGEGVGELCGLHSGVPLTARQVEETGRLPDQIRMFRGPISRLAASESRRSGGFGPRRGRGYEAALERQIRITLLHEIGHHFGMDEAQLEELGYG